MGFLVISKESSQKIYSTDDPEIELESFTTKEEAEYYLQFGKRMNKMNKINVFTDGACSNNGRNSAKAGIGIFIAQDDPRNVSKSITGKQTNNTAELSAVIEVFHVLKEEVEQGKNVIIYTDSEYVIKCCTSYGEKCEKKNWKNKKADIPNAELVKQVYTLYKQHDNVKIVWIRAHTNKNDTLSKGNEGADRLANLSIEEEGCPYSK